MDFKYDPILGVLRKADGASGTDTSDATAVAGDILNGKTAYGANGKLTGTIPTVTASMSDNVVTVPKGYVKSAQTLTAGTALNAFTITPAANAQVISKGSYLRGEVTVAGDANLTASNIKSGVTIFNVAGTYEGESSGGTSAEYYKCASVSSGTSGEKLEGRLMTMSFIDVVDFNYNTEATVIHLTMTDTTKTGLDREWVSSDGVYTFKKYVNNAEGYISWGLYKNSDNTYSHYITTGLLDQDKISSPDGEGITIDLRDPWEIKQLYSEAGFMDTQTISWGHSIEPVGGGKTWSGYKAVFDSTAGTWSFEDTVTEGLAYTSVTPVVGGIYSADALVIVSLLYTGTPTLTSPTGMTSESSDEWEISASSFYSNNYPPWEAFDGVKGSDVNCWTGANGASSWWLQWQNKKKQVLVQRLRIQGTSSNDIAQQAITSFVLQGSNDGSTWSDIGTVSGLTWSSAGYEWKEFTFSNNKSYYYHRLANIKATSFPTIVELETYDL